MAEDRLFVSLRRALRGIFSKTAEQAEEAMMETETVAVTTEQPVLSEPLSIDTQGAAVPGEAAAVGLPNPKDQGTPVDPVPSTQEVEHTNTSSDSDKAISAETGKTVSGQKIQAEDKDSKPESKLASAGDGGVTEGGKDETKSVTKRVEEPAKTVEQTAEHSEDSVENKEDINFDKKEGWDKFESKATGSRDRLEKLSLQIDDFDTVLDSDRPSSLPVSENKGAEESVELVGDLTDKIIDELIEEASNVSDIDTSKSGNKVTERQVSSGDDDAAEGEVTPENEMSDDSPITESKDLKTGSLSAVETNANDAESRVNGKATEECMSASTESDGFVEEKSNEEKPKQAQSTNQNTEKKSEKGDRKGETTSPTKTGKSKKKEDKSIEHILKALSSLQSTEEKLAALCKKYADLHEDHRVLQTSFKQGQRKLTVISREKDQLQTEHTKAVMAKSKLESLCRELQKHNQTIRQESLQRAKEEDEKRKEISQKFQTTIGEIQQQMQENHDRNKQLREENFELANKLKKFIEQYETREKQVEKVIQHRELEQKLADAKLEQASAILMEEKTRSQKDREVLLLQSADSMKKIQLKDTELKMYKERYEEFQSTIKRSEEMFNKFKTEMDKMTKRCKKLDKETVNWKGKWENANRALLEMAEEKQRYDKEKTLLMTKISKLESLCRAMQAERKARKLLENEGVDMSKLALDDDIPSIFDPPCPSEAPQSAPAPSPVSQSPTPVQSTEQEPVTKSTIEDIDEDEDDDSDLSSASETTGETVLQPESQQAQQPDTSQSESPTGEDSQSKTQEVTDQSESGTEQTNQSEGNNQTDAAS